MRTLRLAVTAFLSASLVVPVVTAPAALAQEDILKKAINNPAVSAYGIYGSKQTNSAIKDETVQGGDARRVVVTEASAQPWDATAQTAIKGRIKQGDQIVAVVWLKSVETDGSAPKVTLRLQESGAPYTGLIQKDHVIKGEWEMYTVEIVATKDYPKDTTAFAVQLAHSKQTVDIGPSFVLNMGPKS
ncbi:MAG: hypothetical protein AAGC58_07260 [Asticcacaulis sp.]